MEASYLQRIRVTFSKIGPTRWIGNLDLQRAWERALNRAKIPMAYTQGFNRRPRMQLASALGLGFTSECEIIDLWLAEKIDPAEMHTRLMEKMAPGIEVHSVEEVYLRQSALPAMTVDCHYKITLVYVEMSEAELQQRIDTLWAAEEVLRPKKGRKNKGKMYDLRPLILAIKLGEPEGDFLTIDVHVQLMEGKTGRPDEILFAMDIDPADTRIHRTQLALDSAKLTVA